MSAQATTPTPIPAWVAAALTLLTLPMSAYPFLVSVKLKMIKSKSNEAASGGGARLLVFPPSLQRGVWALAIVAHLGLTLFAIVTALEAECLGRPTDYGYAELDSPCPKHQIRRFFTLLEVIISPVYPTAIFLLYNSLNPTLSRKIWKRMLSRSLVACIVCTTLVLLAACVGGVLLVMSKPGSPTNALVVLYQRWYMTIFNLWFIFMVILGVVSLHLTIRLLPWLQRRNRNSRAQQQGTASIASFNTAESHATVTTGGATTQAQGSSATAHFESMTQSGTPRLPNTSSTESNVSHLPIAATTEAPNTSDKQLDASIRRLKAFLLTILIVLMGNAGMVAFRPFPFVLHSVIGWISCRAVSVLLFAATREVKKAVLTRNGGNASTSPSSGAKGNKGGSKKEHGADKWSSAVQGFQGCGGGVLEKERNLSITWFGGDKNEVICVKSRSSSHS
ncbi:hypothetical protein BCR44DRAFT_95480 [Catenaria anguillulae PL171]|uniref:Uncharacterized protein n=1 Tax=Catenaria anguillulae PL171 TaxID=765915 RepID=A0A1Y2H886_9FUNG|nr:hypothetical protein BCR44DRAFT_95480 [Catenaria anguillulae PL171]